MMLKIWVNMSIFGAQQWERTTFFKDFISVSSEIYNQQLLKVIHLQTIALSVVGLEGY